MPKAVGELVALQVYSDLLGKIRWFYQVGGKDRML
jgi:hypothetical protein